MTIGAGVPPAKNTTAPRPAFDAAMGTTPRDGGGLSTGETGGNFSLAGMTENPEQRDADGNGVRRGGVESGAGVVTDLSANKPLRRTLKHLATVVGEPDTRWNELCRRVDPQRLIRNLTQEHIEGADKECSDELDRHYRRTEPNSATIPWETLAYRNQRYAANRADTVGTLSGGGYLVETVNFPSAAGALLSLLILGKLGATAVNSTANLNLPRVSSSANTYWLTGETSALTESEQSFGQVSFSPHQLGGYTEMSRLLVLQSSPDAADTVASDLVRKIKRTIEAAAFNGSGTAGQPHGIIGLTGVTTASGASATLSTFTTAVSQIGDALDVDSNPGGPSRAAWRLPCASGTKCPPTARFPSGAVPRPTAS